MENCKPLSTPGVKPTCPLPLHGEDEDVSEAEPLPSAIQTVFRGGAARCNYLSSDRPDISFATKELCRSMSAPREEDMGSLKRVCRFLKGKPRLVQRIPGTVLREGARTVKVYVDSDWAGCRRTRKSTNGGVLMVDGACLKFWSTTQAVRALSSGEAEYYAGLKRGRHRTWLPVDVCRFGR